MLSKTNHLKKIQLDYKIFFLICWIMSFTILFLRYPNAFFFPNFFAEDGGIFVDNIIKNGFLSSIFYKFNGYLISGLYILTYFAIQINKIVTGEFIYLPTFISLVANAFFSFVLCLPILLFYNKIKPQYLFILVILTSFIPFKGWNYAILGVIGNLKFLFTYLALQLIIFRIFLEKNSMKIPFIDFVLIICAFTNLNVYALIPFIFINEIQEIIKTKQINHIFKKNLALISGITTSLILLIPVIQTITYGLPIITGYLDTPYEFNKTISIFIGRTYLYPMINSMFHLLNDGLVLIIFFIIISVIFIFRNKNYTKIYFFAIYSIFISTLLLILARPGLHEFFNGYSGHGPAQFFYSQNIIFIFLLILSIQDLIQNKKIYAKIIGVLITLMLIFNVPFSGNFAFGIDNNDPLIEIGSFKKNVEIECKKKFKDPLYIKIYPDKKLLLEVDRKSVCNSKSINEN